MDGDGDVDLVTITAGLEAVAWRNDGTGALTEAARWPLDWSASYDADYTDAKLVDLDLDGALDLVVEVPWQYDPDPTVLVHLGDGTGGFEPAGFSLVVAAPAGGPYQVVTGDLDGDGALDLVLGADWYGIQTAPWTGAGLGTTTTWSTTLQAPYGFEADDVDGDGDVDLLASSCFDLELMVQDAGALVSAGTTHLADICAGAVSSRLSDLADFDGDGCQDAVSVVYPDGLSVTPFLCHEAPVDTGEPPADTGEGPAPADTGTDEAVDSDTGTALVAPPSATGCMTGGRAGMSLGASLLALAMAGRHRRRLPRR